MQMTKRTALHLPAPLPQQQLSHGEANSTTKRPKIATYLSRGMLLKIPMSSAKRQKQQRRRPRKPRRQRKLQRSPRPSASQNGRPRTTVDWPNKTRMRAARKTRLLGENAFDERNRSQT
jgi:hypothetical protein